MHTFKVLCSVSIVPVHKGIHGDDAFYTCVEMDWNQSEAGADKTFPADVCQGAMSEMTLILTPLSAAHGRTLSAL